jgi:hypothetical protein
MTRAPSRQLSIRCLQAFAAVVVLMLPALLWSWATPAPYADLTRIGRFSEASFGWRGSQPAVSAASLQATPIDQADVLVIGDSFSAQRLWQSVLVEGGWRVATWHWNSVDHLCRDLEPWLRRQGYQGHRVVLQVVERHLPALVDKSRGCSTMPALRATAAKLRTDVPLTHPPEPAVNWQARLDTGAVTTWNNWLAERDDASFVVREGEHVRVASVARGCELFSHRLCRRALFLADDLDLPPALPDHVTALPAVAASTPTLRIVWLVTPNKSTVYLQPERARQLGAVIRQTVVAQGLGIDLFGALMERRETLRDLYFPGDTHLSTAGYLEMGRLVTGALGPAPAR